MRRFALLAALVMVFSVTGAANAGNEHFAHWGCGETVTWKTNANKKLVKKEIKRINSTVNSFTLVKSRGGGKPDIKLNFVSRKKMYDVTGERNVLGVAFYSLFEKKWFKRVKVFTPKLRKSNNFFKKQTFVHELWHAVGMDHIPTGQRVSLMNPYQDKSNRTKFPTSADIDALKALDDFCVERPDEGETEKPPPIVDYPSPTSSPTPTSTPTPTYTSDPAPTPTYTSDPTPTPTYTSDPTPTETGNPPPPTETSDPDPDGDLFEDCGNSDSQDSCSHLV
jgi:hypothetical protein